MALFFYAFVIIGGFFAVNLFVGVVVDQFGRMKEEFEGSALLTKDQQQWCVDSHTLMRHAVCVCSCGEEVDDCMRFPTCCLFHCPRCGGLNSSLHCGCGCGVLLLLCHPRVNLNRVLEAIKPRLYEEAPNGAFRASVFRIVKWHGFEKLIMGFITANTFLLSLEHYDQTAA